MLRFTALALFACAAVFARAGEDRQRVLSLADTLAIQEANDIQFDPTGNHVVFRVSRRDTGDFSLETQSYMSGRLFIAPVRNPSNLRLLLPPDPSREGERIISFSPDGSRIVLIWLRQGELKMGAYELTTHRLVEFSFVPALLQFSSMHDEIAWVSDHEIICSALPAGERSGAVVFSRRSIALKLMEKWEDAWSGRRSTSDVLESHSGYPPLPARPGSLVKVDARTGESRVLAEGVFFDFSLSPNGRYLAAAQQGAWHQPAPDIPFGNTEFSADFRRYSAVIFDLQSGAKRIDLAKDHQLMVSSRTFVWGSDSRSLVFYGARGDKRWKDGEFVRYDVSRRRAEFIRPHDVEVAMVRESRDFVIANSAPLTNGLAVLARSKSHIPRERQRVFANRLDWYHITADGKSRSLTRDCRNVSREHAGFDSDSIRLLCDGDVWQITAKGQRRNLTRFSEPGLALFSGRVRVQSGVNHAKRGAAFWAYTTDRRRVLFFDSEGLILATVPIPPNTRDLFALSLPAGAAVVELGTYPGTSLSVARSEQDIETFWHPNRWLSEIDPPRAVSVRYQTGPARDSEATAGLILPKSWTEGRRVPAIVEMYPGQPGTPPTPLYRPQSVELFASMGYAVLTPQLHETRLASDEHILGNLSALVLPAIEAAVASGYIDPDRIVVSGGSAGGWTVLSLLTQSDRFKAAIASFSTADFLSYYGSQNLMAHLYPQEIFPAAPLYDEIPGFHLSFGVPPWSDPARFVRASPLFAVEQINTPVMLVASDLDFFTLDHFNRLFTALFRLRKDAQLVRYWGEAHGLTSPANLRDSWARQLAWADRWCDIARDANGAMIFEGSRVMSRNGSPPLTPADFRRWEWFFEQSSHEHRHPPTTSRAPFIS